MIDVLDLIHRKRDGETLSARNVAGLVDAYTRGDVPDYQMSAFLMAAFLRGLDAGETDALTHAMLHSGVVLDLSSTPGRKVDKHSTGGVGDKVSLLLAPIVAACGVRVPMISGRGLGHTGGTLDKLESIPGLRTDLTVDAYRAQLAELGVVMIGQTDEIAPADRKLYALRDVTGTVECIPLIAASIMSKKLAEGIDALVLDVKCGRGAFMKNESDARRLAETLARIGDHAGKPTVALLTRMDVPLGRAVGNWPEVAESVRCLRGADDGEADDLMEVTYALAGEMLVLGGAAGDPAEGRKAAREAVASGAAYERFEALVAAQGGDVGALDTPERAPTATVHAPEGAGAYVVGVDALAVGRAAVALGAGRARKEDAVDPQAGLVLARKPGERIEPGAPLAHLWTRRTDALDALTARIRRAFTFADAPPERADVLMGRYADGAWTEPAS